MGPLLPSRISRRDLLAAGAAGLVAGVAAPRSLVAAGAVSAGPRKKIALLGTVIFEHSHTQHILDRLCSGYSWQGRWQEPRLDVAAVHIAQFPEGDGKEKKPDLGRQRIERYSLKSFPTVREALTLGTGKLAVDGVVIIAEHGDYPKNDKGQTRYPRYEWFKECVKVFEDSGRSVPVFNDKHLSTEWNECAEMVADARRLGFPFLAGSSLPITVRQPAIDMPLDVPLLESVCMCYGGVDSYDFHGLETAQCMSERRRGGEVGIRSVHALRGAKLWETLAGADREVTRRLIVAALNRSHNLPVEGGWMTEPVTFEWARKTLADSTGYLIDHRDGFRTTMIMGPLRDFTYAGLRTDSGEIVSCLMHLPMPHYGATTADFFHPLTRHIETFVLDNREPFPVERTLLTSGMVIGGVESLAAGETPYATPQMGIAYRAPRESTYWHD